MSFVGLSWNRACTSTCSSAFVDFVFVRGCTSLAIVDLKESDAKAAAEELTAEIGRHTVLFVMARVLTCVKCLAATQPKMNSM